MLVSMLAACSSHPLGPPGEEVLPEDRFVDLLIDVHYYEGVLEFGKSTLGYWPELRTDSIDFYRQVLDLHNVSREEFKKTMDYYSYNPPQFEALYTRVVDELNKRLMEAEMEDNPEKIMQPEMEDNPEKIMQPQMEDDPEKMMQPEMEDNPEKIMQPEMEDNPEKIMQPQMEDDPEKMMQPAIDSTDQFPDLRDQTPN